MAEYRQSYATVVSVDIYFGLGAVFLQDQSIEEPGAIAFSSRALTLAQKRYSQKKGGIGYLLDCSTI